MGAEYAGTVKAVSDFGAFVNFGVEKQDGLVHKSQLSDDFVVDPSDIVSVGQKVSVRVLSVDIEQRKISLSMKSENAPAKQERSPRRSSNGPDLSKYVAASSRLVFFSLFSPTKPTINYACLVHSPATKI